VGYLLVTLPLFYPNSVSTPKSAGTQSVKAKQEICNTSPGKHEDTRTQGKRKGGAGSYQCMHVTAEEGAGQPGMAKV